jgi:hypothetical protein
VTVAKFLSQFHLIFIYPKIFHQVTDHGDHTLRVTFYIAKIRKFDSCDLWEDINCVEPYHLFQSYCNSNSDFRLSISGT